MAAPPLYPLRFRPILKQYIWGGCRLGSLLSKPLPPGQTCAESWEICDRPEEQSRVAAGPLAGAALRQLLEDYGPAMLGLHDPQPRFPLLWKFLDAAKTLSVQVHPNDAQAARLDPPDFGKNEAWVVLAAAPGSIIYAGLRRGVDRHALAEAIRQGTCRDVLHTVAARPGDCLFVPAGTVHALGEGLLVAEVQQSSDVTYRLFDWNRLGADGKPRPLHVQQGLDVIDFDRGPVEPQRPQATDRPGVERLVECQKFVLERGRSAVPQTIGGDRRCHILCVLEGALAVEGDAAGVATVGATLLLPAGLGAIGFRPQGPSVWLDAWLP